MNLPRLATPTAPRPASACLGTGHLCQIKFWLMHLKLHGPNSLFGKGRTRIEPPSERAKRQSTRGLPIYWTSQRKRAPRRFMSCSCV
jgi:hypothetical protein